MEAQLATYARRIARAFRREISRARALIGEGFPALPSGYKTDHLRGGTACYPRLSCRSLAYHADDSMPLRSVWESVLLPARASSRGHRIAPRTPAPTAS